MEKEAEDFLSKQGFPIIESKIFSDDKEAYVYARKLGFPVVLKITGKLHKSDLHGVKINVHEEDFFSDFFYLKKLTKKVMVQKHIEGKQIILGIKKDPTFGHVIIFGLGGIFVETLKDLSFRVYPLEKNDVEEMIKEIKGYEILLGTRGEKPVDISKIKLLLLKLSKLTKKYKNLEELDINPLIVNEREAKVVDARIVFSWIL